ncbi:MAG: carboxyl transferase domain-containing protein, partial [Spirochaetia bacterium]
MLHRLFRSRIEKQTKQELLRQAIFALEELPIPEERREAVSDLLDEIAVLSTSNSQALSDVAIHARYRLVDREVLQELREERREHVGRAVELIERAGERRGDVERIMDRVVDSGHSMDANLVEAIHTERGSRRSAVLEMLARRFNRDREVEEVRLLTEGTAPGAVVHSSDIDGSHETVVLAPTSASARKIVEAVQQALDTSFVRAHAPEVLVLVDTRRDNTLSDAPAHDLFEALEQETLDVSWLSVGVIESAGTTYRTFRPADSGMGADAQRGPFNPLRYRELRIHRLKHFDTTVCYASEFVTLLSARSKDNSRDERFIAIVEVPSTRLERDEEGGIRRMVAFEKVFMEAVYAMRAEQAKRRRRLQWNRIIIHVRSMLNVGLEGIREYAANMASRTVDLGLEKIVVYSRRWNSKMQSPEEVELLFENISGSSFSLRGRTPSLEALQPMDSYTARVVRARQRGTIYPYELIKLITRTGVQVSERFPKGSFEEFDIDVVDGETKCRSVGGRPYGEAQSNIVFGIIRSSVPGFPDGLSRVIILSDTTGDMGSLSEPECRRVNAALDLAEARGLPVEWLPISAGARIDMESGTENLDWTAATLRRIIDFTQKGGEINVIVTGINVGAQSYWNAEATMLMHTRGLLIMTDDAAMLLTGKRALDFSGSISAEDNVGIGGADRIMEPNGQAQIRVRGLFEAYAVLFRHYGITWTAPGNRFPDRRETSDAYERNVATETYTDNLGQGFATIGDIFS